MFRLIWGLLAALGLYLGLTGLWDWLGSIAASIPFVPGWGDDQGADGGDSGESGDSGSGWDWFLGGSGGSPNAPPAADVPGPAGEDDDFLEVGYGSPVSGLVEAQVHPQVMEWEADMRAASDRADVPTDLIAVTMHRESAGDPNATGDDGESAGLMQIKAATQETVNLYFEVTLNRMVPLHNLYLGALNIRRCHEEMEGGWVFGGPNLPTWHEAIRAYLCGVQGAQSDASCGADEAMMRLEMANLPTPNAV